MLFKLSQYETLPGFNRVASALIKENNLPISSEEDFGRFFPDQVNPAQNYFDFFERMKPLTNTEKFISTIKNHDQTKKICIYGDYDADGIMATTIMVHSLSKLGYNVCFEIPNRLEDGYGMNKETVEKLINEKNVSLIITVDNGISGKEFIDCAKDLGCQVIVTDHHLPTEDVVPTDTVIIDPKYTNDEFSDICGATVALKLCYALYTEISPQMLSVIETVAPLAGIATVTDMMSMIDENRDLVRLTLYALDSVKRNSKHPLYKMLSSLGGQNFLRSESQIATEELISFYIGPAINAISRVNGDVTQVVQKILECFERPWAYIPSYTSINYTRQRMSNELLKDFQYDEDFSNVSVFVYDSTNYPYNIKGILGLIANKVSNKYKIVSLVGTKKDESVIEFSGRSTPSYDLHEGIERIKQVYPELGISGGGHAQAMGIRLNIEDSNNLEKFKHALNGDIILNSIPYDPHIFEWEPELEEEIIETLGDLQPYGAAFQKLKFSYSNVFIEYDYDSKIACIGEYKFKMYIPPAQIDELIGTDIDVLFTIAYNSSDGPIFNVVNE